MKTLSSPADALRRLLSFEPTVRIRRLARATPPRFSRLLTALAVLVLPVSLGACSSPMDVAEAERAADAICEILRPLPGVGSADCAVDDGGFDAGISRDTDVELVRSATAEQAHRVITTWLSSKDGGFDEYEIAGSRAAPLHLTIATVAEASFTVGPGSAPPGVAFVQEWLGHAQNGMPITASVDDGRRIRLAEDGLSPAEQADLLDEFSMQTRTDLLTLAIGSDSTIESPVPASLGPILREFDAAHRGLAGNGPERELELRVDVFQSGPPRLWWRIPTALAPAFPSDTALTDAPGWASIRTLLEAAAPGGDVYSVTITARPGQVLGRFSTSGCEPELSGPAAQFGEELQTQWATIHGIDPTPASCVQ